MKTCPSCQRAYEDDSLVFCLDDGSRLAGEGPESPATWVLPNPGPTVASPRSTSPTAPPTITTRPEQFQIRPPHGAAPNVRDEPRRSALPWVFAIVLVLGISGVLIAWFITRGGSGDDVSGKYATPTPVPSVVEPSPEATADETPTPTPRLMRETPTPTPEGGPMFQFLNNTSFNGSRITYYQRPSFALCQADCARNPSCKGLTWIRPGAYNPSDPGMCYLMSAVTDRIPTTCCVSAVRN